MVEFVTIQAPLLVAVFSVARESYSKPFGLMVEGCELSHGRSCRNPVACFGCFNCCFNPVNRSSTRTRPNRKHTTQTRTDASMSCSCSDAEGETCSMHPQPFPCEMPLGSILQEPAQKKQQACGYRGSSCLIKSRPLPCHAAGFGLNDAWPPPHGY